MKKRNLNVKKISHKKIYECRKKICVWGIGSVGLATISYLDQNICLPNRSTIFVKKGLEQDFLDLEKWYNFELEFPKTFISIYRLSCHKK